MREHLGGEVHHYPDILISGEDGNIFFRGRQQLHTRFLSRDLIAGVYAIAAGRDDIAVGCTGPKELFVRGRLQTVFGMGTGAVHAEGTERNE